MMNCHRIDFFLKSGNFTVILVILLIFSISCTFFSKNVLAQSLTDCNEIFSRGTLSLHTDVTKTINISREEPLNVNVTISNTFPYELPNVRVLATVTLKGDTVPVDWFVAREAQSYQPGVSEEIMMDWHIPQNLPAGEYKLQFYSGQGTEQQLLMRAVSAAPADATLMVIVEPTPSEFPARLGVSFDFSKLTINGEPVTLGKVNEFSVDADTLEVAYQLTNTAAAAHEGSLEVAVYQGYTLHPSQRAEIVSKSLKLLPDVSDGSSIMVELQADHYILVGRYVGTDGSRSSFLLPVAREGDTIDINTPTPSLIHFGISNSTEGDSAVACLAVQPKVWNSNTPLLYSQEISYEVVVYETVDGVKSDDIYSKGAGTQRSEGSGKLNIAINEPIKLPDGPFQVHLMINGEISEILNPKFITENPQILLGTYVFEYSCNPVAGCDTKNDTNKQINSNMDFRDNPLMTMIWFIWLSFLFLMITLYIFKLYKSIRARKKNQPNNEHENE
jgi:hypothetical protein